MMMEMNERERIITLFNLLPISKRDRERGRVYSTNGISPTIQVFRGGNRVIKVLIDYGQKKRKKEMEENKEQSQIKLPKELKGRNFRIRKLTPRECFRLMDVDDADIDKIQATGMANTNQYKLAGNSIVVNVLYHVFRKMFIETDIDKNENQPTQLTLF